MRKDKDLVQMGIVVKPELREWFVNKCSLARTNEDRIVSISTILGYYLERLRELDELDPFNTCPILKKDNDSSPQHSLETSSAVDLVEIVNPIKEQIKHLEAKFNETPDYEQKLALLEERLTKTIDDKISELLARKQSEALNNFSAITSDSAERIDATIAPILRRLEQLESDYQQSTSNSDSDLTSDSLNNLESNPNSDLLDDLKDDSHNEAAETQLEDVKKTETMTKAEMARTLGVSASSVGTWVRNGKWSKFPTDWEWHPIREHFERLKM